MPDRYDDRHRGGSYERDRYQTRDDRGFIDRAGDEVRSWFGDDEAARRRERDERREREQYRGRSRDDDYGRHERNYASGDPAWSRRGGYGPEESRRQVSGGWGPEEDWRGGYSAGEPYLGGTVMGAERGWGETYSGPSSVRSYRSERYGGASPGDPDRGFRSYSGSFSELSSARQGPFTGRGPKGYQRSDDRIREDVCDRLTDDPMLDASDIEVAVSRGEVTLSGSVRDRDDKRRAEDIIERISGVREVHNSLRVNRTEVGTPGNVLGLGPNAASTPPGQSEIRGTTATGRSGDFGTRK